MFDLLPQEAEASPDGRHMPFLRCHAVVVLEDSTSLRSFSARVHGPDEPQIQIEGAMRCFDCYRSRNEKRAHDLPLDVEDDEESTYSGIP